MNKKKSIYSLIKKIYFYVIKIYLADINISVRVIYKLKLKYRSGKGKREDPVLFLSVL